LLHKYINTKAKFSQSSITMSKTREYSSDVQQNIVELHKIESEGKTIAKALKCPHPSSRQ